MKKLLLLLLLLITIGCSTTTVSGGNTTVDYGRPLSVSLNGEKGFDVTSHVEIRHATIGKGITINISIYNESRSLLGITSYMAEPLVKAENYDTLPNDWYTRNGWDMNINPSMSKSISISFVPKAPGSYTTWVYVTGSNTTSLSSKSVCKIFLEVDG